MIHHIAVLNLPMTIRSKRIERGWSQEFLASETGIPRSSISKIECGTSIPSIDQILRIESAFNLSIGTLLIDSIPVSKKRSLDTYRSQADAFIASLVNYHFSEAEYVFLNHFVDLFYEFKSQNKSSSL
ncbi:MAG: helix-turn-helix transcriptional regulator [Clostridia bacterium]|nr:helix-turn-helix transcriptional regulator [Clostridia bacterium]MBR1711774.1 helix-turn-helix transcriptional regulator [Clostridia bacterium]